MRVRQDGGVLVIKFNRPAMRNALNLAVATAVAEAIDRLDTDDGLLVGILTGNGGTFSAGMSWPHRTRRRARAPSPRSAARVGPRQADG